MVQFSVGALLIVFAPLQNGWTPLHAAAFKGHIEVVHALVAAGASINKAENVRSIAARVVYIGAAVLWFSLVWVPSRSDCFFLPRIRMGGLRFTLLRTEGTSK